MTNLTILAVGRCAAIWVALVWSCVSMHAGDAFLDQKKSLKPAQEWNREVVCKTNGTIRVKITSDGPFIVCVLSDKAYKALLKRDMDAFKKEGFVFTADSKDKVFERSLELKSGSYWFVIRNNLKQEAEVRLECFAVQAAHDAAKPKS